MVLPTLLRACTDESRHYEPSTTVELQIELIQFVDEAVEFVFGLLLFIGRPDPQFVEYVRQLLQLCDGYPHEDQQQYFNEVLRHERDFWKMTWEG